MLRRAGIEDDVKYPRCVAGQRACPPEDVGGYPGYADFLEAWLDSGHEEHKAMRRWAGTKFDPER
ncbi:plasmid pRiA4b ORF-3 family protein, partial [Acinetobacter baumannii]